LVLALAGVGILLYAVRGTATPTAKIGEIGATMNFAYLRIQGTITRGPIYDADAQSLRFYVADDTGEIQVAAFRDVTAELIAGQVPAIGDRITADGTLRVRDDFTSFNLSSAETVRLSPPPLAMVKLGELARSDEMRFVRVQGNVREIREPYRGLTLYTLGDDRGELDVAVYQDIETLYGPVVAVGAGDTLEVQGVVTVYRDTPQIALRHPNDLRRLASAEDAAATSHIADLDMTRLNQRVQLSGQLWRVSDFSQGIRALLTDGTGEITVILWDNVLDEIPRASELADGARITLLGRVSEYRGELELLPERGSDVRLVALAAENRLTPTPPPSRTPGPTNTPRPTRQPTTLALRTAASVTTDDLDQNIRLAGSIVEIRDFSAGQYITLQDSTGTLRVVLFENVLLPIRDSVTPGARLTVHGRVNLFAGKLEVVADSVTFP
jgi:DNA/RNA endonuclease YhcR with UshA esterase domain